MDSFFNYFSEGPGGPDYFPVSYLADVLGFTKKTRYIPVAELILFSLQNIRFRLSI